nr:MAG TPA: hypothetical protein [Caudoviricetes sp.]
MSFSLYLFLAKHCEIIVCKILVYKEIKINLNNLNEIP